MDKFLIWGTGADALKYGTYWSKMEQNGVGEIVGFVDKDIRKRGQRFWGKVIYMPDEIASLDFVYLDIWSSKYYKEIYSEAVDRYHISPEKIRELLENMGFETVASNGYMLFMGDDDVIRNPELRHGVIRGRKRCL